MARHETLRAVIYVPSHLDSSVAWAWLRICADHCWTHGRRIVAVVAGGRWEDAVMVVMRGEADVVVIGRWEDAPAGALRLESATSDDSPIRP